MDVDDLDATVSATASALRADQPYAEPAEHELAAGVAGLTRLAGGDVEGAAVLLAPLGFSVAAGTDALSGRGFALALAEGGPETSRRWGLFLADLTSPPRVSVAVPHPFADGLTEQLGLRLWRSVPGAVLAMATVHRDAAAATADHARATRTLFHRFWTDVLGPFGLPQVQLHGFADTTAAEQVVVSTGSGLVTPPAARIAARIADAGLDTTRGWDGTGPVALRATTNAQGIAAAAAGWPWAHIEHRRSVRADAALWHAAIDAAAAAL
jgi:hypothetical protein